MYKIDITHRRTDNDDLTVTGLSYSCCDRRSRPPADLQWLTFWHDERIEFACQKESDSESVI